MIREPVPFKPTRRVSTRSSARFFHLVEVIAKAYESTPSQLERLDRSYNSTGEFLAECPEFRGLLVQIHSHGSRRLGTIVRPRDGSREGFDIDLIARLMPSARQKYQGENGAALLLNHLHTALLRYADTHGLKLRRWERCATLEYAEGMCADIAPVIDAPSLSGPYADTHGLIPDRELRLFNSTNPRGYARHFDLAAKISPNFPDSETFVKAMDSARSAEVVPLPDAQEVSDRLLCRLVQLLKLHRNVAFEAVANPALAPTSVFLTTLAATAYAAEAPLPHASPLELLLDIVQRMPSQFARYQLLNGAEEWHLPNPSAPADNLAATMNSAGRQAAFAGWHNRLTRDLERILDAIEHQQGMDVLLKAIRIAFGSRGFDAIHQMEAGRQERNRQVGRTILFSSAVATPARVAARPHTFFGG